MATLWLDWSNIVLMTLYASEYAMDGAVLSVAGDMGIPMTITEQAFVMIDLGLDTGATLLETSGSVSQPETGANPTTSIPMPLRISFNFFPIDLILSSL